jgi:hypothetical protein
MDTKSRLKGGFLFCGASTRNMKFSSRYISALQMRCGSNGAMPNSFDKNQTAI